MANNITNKFDNNLPDYLRNESNANSIDLGNGGFPTISIKGKVFSVVVDGERKIIERPDEPGTPASSIAGVIVNTSSGVVKTYYDGTFSEDLTDHRPRCFSNDGLTPDSSVTDPICNSCALCKYNAFGTSKNADGTFGKGKACTDAIRIALMTGANKDVYLLRVPAGSLRAFRDFHNEVRRRGAPINGVIVKIGFEMKDAYPKLTFQPIGYVSREEFARINALAQDPTVLSIIGAKVDGDAKPVIKIQKAEEPAPVLEAPKPTKAPAKKAAPKPAPKEEEPEPEPEVATADEGWEDDAMQDVSW